MPGARLTQCVVNPMRTAALACALFALGACTARPFQPNPPAYTMWEKKGVTEDGVRAAMRDCGFASATSNDSVNMTGNDYAGAELCMIDNGFIYKGRRIACTDFPERTACARVPRGKTFGTDPDFDPARLASRPVRPPAYTYWTRPETDVEGVKHAMMACGYNTVIEPTDSMLLNDIAGAQLCMIEQRFTYAWPVNSLLCKSTPGLAACRNRPIDAERCCARPKAAGQR